MRTANCSSAQKPGATKFLNLLLGNALFAVCARIAGHATFVDVFCNYCIPHKQLAVPMVTRPLFPSD